MKSKTKNEAGWLILILILLGAMMLLGALESGYLPNH